MTVKVSGVKRWAGALAVAGALTVGAVSAQTRISAPPTNYSTSDDVRIGQQSEAQVRRQLPLLRDDRVDNYVEDIGRRLVRAVPSRLRRAGFRYSFDVVDRGELNAFALPGGPIFINRGMLAAARNEAEIAGVLAHELSHVVLRHGTAQATKGQKFQLGAVAGQILGAIVGGRTGDIIATGSNIGLSTYFMKYSREYERQADLLGAQILANAGYDPRHMANMFRTIERRDGGGGPEWLSSHPSPGNRHDAIEREARLLRVTGGGGSRAGFSAMQSRLRRT
jgi:predicted Zn-dependent protease